VENKRIIEIIVGIFILLGILSLLLLALRVSGLREYSTRNTFTVTAMFDDIGDLKVRAPVKLAGVKIGEVASINLDSKTFKALITMLIDDKSKLPIDSSASILSASLLGSNYVAITPGFSDKNIEDGGEITETHPAIILENLIGQAVFTPERK
jgi:phospholipid/cholesterol/gamma-HCH transport system substrate-binding protein